MAQAGLHITLQAPQPQRADMAHQIITPVVMHLHILPLDTKPVSFIQLPKDKTLSLRKRVITRNPPHLLGMMIYMTDRFETKQGAHPLPPSLVKIQLEANHS
jgi:hypothetical protein